MYYAYNDADNSGCQFNRDESGEIYMGAYGYFVPTSAPSNEDAGGDGEYVDYEDTGDSGGYYIDDDYHVDISSFEGCWYYDGDLSADRYILIDAYGEWFYYARNEGDAEASEIDCGDLRIAEGETSTYYADSDWYSNVSYRVFEFDTGVLTWDENSKSSELRRMAMEYMDDNKDSGLPREPTNDDGNANEPDPCAMGSFNFDFFDPFSNVCLNTWFRPS